MFFCVAKTIFSIFYTFSSINTTLLRLFLYFLDAKPLKNFLSRNLIVFMLAPTLDIVSAGESIRLIALVVGFARVPSAAGGARVGAGANPSREVPGFLLRFFSMPMTLAGSILITCPVKLTPRLQLPIVEARFQ